MEFEGPKGEGEGGSLLRDHPERFHFVSNVYTLIIKTINHYWGGAISSRGVDEIWLSGENVRLSMTKSSNSPGFNPSILRHRGIRGAVK
jgi:hypothetical protein